MRVHVSNEYLNCPFYNIVTGHFALTRKFHQLFILASIKSQTATPHSNTQISDGDSSVNIVVTPTVRKKREQLDLPKKTKADVLHFDKQLRTDGKVCEDFVSITFMSRSLSTMYSCALEYIFFSFLENHDVSIQK